jgi:hypothetical protein
VKYSGVADAAVGGSEGLRMRVKDGLVPSSPLSLNAQKKKVEVAEQHKTWID